MPVIEAPLRGHVRVIERHDGLRELLEQRLATPVCDEAKKARSRIGISQAKWVRVMAQADHIDWLRNEKGPALTSRGPNFCTGSASTVRQDRHNLRPTARTKRSPPKSTVQAQRPRASIRTRKRIRPVLIRHDPRNSSPCRHLVKRHCRHRSFAGQINTTAD